MSPDSSPVRTFCTYHLQDLAFGNLFLPVLLLVLSILEDLLPDEIVSAFSRSEASSRNSRNIYIVHIYTEKINSCINANTRFHETELNKSSFAVLSRDFGGIYKDISKALSSC